MAYLSNKVITINTGEIPKNAITIRTIFLISSLNLIVKVKRVAERMGKISLLAFFKQTETDVKQQKATINIHSPAQGSGAASALPWPSASLIMRIGKQFG